MKNLLQFFVMLCCVLTAVAQKQINTEFATKMNAAFQQLEKNRVPYGLLKDQAFEFTELSAYNGVITDTSYINANVLGDIYKTLFMSKVVADTVQRELVANER